LKIDKSHLTEALAEKTKENKILVIKFKELTKNKNALTLDEQQFLELEALANDT
jgi:hypothetical protein